MDFSQQDLVNYLLAASGNIPLDKPGVYLVSEEDGDLIEKLWTGAQVGEQNFIASEIRKDSPALYILNEDEVCQWSNVVARGPAANLRSSDACIAWIRRMPSVATSTTWRRKNGKTRTSSH